MDSSQWPQGSGVGNSWPAEKKPRPQREQALNCPRCNSTSTKFCYYNNYSLSQPRYFCKACRRYWTEGGTLRNVPMGGGSRKKHRSSSSKKSTLADLSRSPMFSPQNPKIQGGKDLNLGCNPPLHNGMSELVAFPFVFDTQNPNVSSASSSHLPFMELLRSAGSFGSGGLSASLVSANHVSDSDPVILSGFPLHELIKPSSRFALDGLGNLQSTVQDQETSSRVDLPFQEMEPVLNGEFEQESVQLRADSNGYWNGMLFGGSL